VSWTPPADEKAIVRSFLTFLEDRRALYAPYHVEIEYEVERSVQEIRRVCTESLSALPEASRAIGPIRMIRSACRRFLDAPRADSRNLHMRDFEGFRDRASFFTGLGELRAAIGLQIAFLAVQYEIELEAELASILPALDEDSDKE
jgi:hypothetical protein